MASGQVLVTLICPYIHVGHHYGELPWSIPRQALTLAPFAKHCTEAGYHLG